MVKLSLKKIALVSAAAAVALGSLSAPAYARGGHDRGHNAYRGNSHQANYRHRSSSHYYGSRNYRRHHRGGLSGGEAALLAAGIIGGVILIDRAIENDRARDARLDDYDRYDGSQRYDDGRYDDGARDLYYRRDDRPYSEDRLSSYDEPDFDDGPLDDDLAGGGEYAGGADYAGSSYNYGAAYNDCKAETRDAARDSGVLVALPSRPDRIEELGGGEAVRFTASVEAQDLRGDRVRRTMTCEADEGGVRFLEIA